jgi:D-xylose transport system permease protein
MSEAAAAAEARPATPTLVADLITLTKPRIISLLLVTTIAPMFITPAGLPSWSLLGWVTLAGYLMFRGAAFLVSDGQTLAPLHQTYQALGGGVNGAIGVQGVLGLLAAIWVAWHIWSRRRDQRRYGIEPAPVWVDALKGALMCAAIAGFVWTMSLAPDFTNVDEAGEPRGRGIGVPVLILLGIVVLMTFVAQRTRYGRYVFAYGGNPEAALLSGLSTTRLVWSLFVLTGVLAARRRGDHDGAPRFGRRSIRCRSRSCTHLRGPSAAPRSQAGSARCRRVLGALLIQTLDNGRCVGCVQPDAARSSSASC